VDRQPGAPRKRRCTRSLRNERPRLRLRDLTSAVAWSSVARAIGGRARRCFAPKSVHLPIADRMGRSRLRQSPPLRTASHGERQTRRLRARDRKRGRSNRATAHRRLGDQPNRDGGGTKPKAFVRYLAPWAGESARYRVLAGPRARCRLRPGHPAPAATETEPPQQCRPDLNGSRPVRRTA